MGLKNKYPRAVYDEANDSLYLILDKGAEEGFIELAPNVNLEIGRKGRIIGIEILGATKVLEGAKRPIELLSARQS